MPFLTAAATSDKVLQKLRSCLAVVIADRHLDEWRDQLFLEGFNLKPATDYAEVLQIESGAAQLGYPKLF